MGCRSRSAKGLWKLLSDAVHGKALPTLLSVGNALTSFTNMEVMPLLFTTSCENAGAKRTGEDTDYILLCARDSCRNERSCCQRHLYLYPPDGICSNNHSSESNLQILSGFDNTGTVALWPGELFLAHSFLLPHLYPGLHSILFDNVQHLPIRRVCEVAAGTTGLAGLSVSSLPAYIIPDLEEVVLTDGNQQCVRSLRYAVHRHLMHMENCVPSYSATQLAWSSSTNTKSSVSADLLHSFQFVIAADCFFYHDGHAGLLQLIDELLSVSPGSIFLALAPLRDGTLVQFAKIAQQQQNFEVLLLPPESYLECTFYNRLKSKLETCNTIDSIQQQLLCHLIVMKRTSSPQL